MYSQIQVPCEVGKNRNFKYNHSFTLTHLHSDSLGLCNPNQEGLEVPGKCVYSDDGRLRGMEYSPTPNSLVCLHPCDLLSHIFQSHLCCAAS